MVHQYQLNGYNIVLDSCSGSIHVVDEVAYDIIALYQEKSADEIVAEMMEKYGALVLRDIAVEIQYEPETWCDDAEGKRLRYEAYARRFLKRLEKAA